MTCASFLFFTKSNVAVYKRIKEYLESLVDWLFKWSLKMNVTKCFYTIFSMGGKNGIIFNFQMNGKSIQYTPNPTFLGITFDEKLTFKVLVQNLRSRTLKIKPPLLIITDSLWGLLIFY